MIKRIVFITLALLFLTSSVYAFDINRPNNKFGIHLAQAHFKDLKAASDLVNSNGGKWGYVTLVIQENDRDLKKWQEVFDYLRELHLIPIIRLATQPDGQAWKRPDIKDASDWAKFLDSLDWVVRDRYIVLFNEPNHGSEWGGAVDPENYAQTALEFAKKLKEKNKDFFIMLAGMDAAAPSSSPNYEDEEEFLRKIFNNETIEQWNNLLSGLASHSYPSDYLGSPFGSGRKSVGTYQWELNLIKSLGFKKDLPVFITETGWLNHRDITSYNFQQVFESVWLPDNRVMAVTPFVLNYQSDPFLSFSWVSKGENGFYPHYYAVQAMGKTAGEPEIIEKGKINFSFFNKLAIDSNYHFEINLKNEGQSIWDKDDGYYLKIEPYESYLFSDIKKIKPHEEAALDLYFKTGSNYEKKDLTISLYKNNKKLISSKKWSIEVLLLPSLNYKLDLYPKLKTNGDNFELQFFDNKEQLVFKKKNLSVKNGEGFLSNIQNISFNEKYRAVVLKPYYLPRQKYITFSGDKNNLKFDNMYPLDFDLDGNFDWKDVLKLIQKPSLFSVFIP